MAMTAKELAERLMRTPDAELTIKTDGVVGPFIEYEVKALAESIKGHAVEIVLKRIV
jgi:hypothetical protein